MLTIGPFAFDPSDQCLWEHGERIDLTPKTFAVLRCLVSRAGKLVTKDELISEVWPEVCVTDAVLKVRIAELRRLLREKPGERRYIETLHRRGYRLIAPIGRVDDRSASNPPPLLADSIPAASPMREQTAEHEPNASRTPTLVGRESCIDRLDRHLDKASGGERQLVFVTGEAGAGKSALLRAFLERVEARGGVRSAIGQCVEHHGSQEAFLPVLDALGKLCRSEQDSVVVSRLRQYAPTWLAQFPWMLRDEDKEPLASELLGATRSRMSREFGVLCDVLSQDAALVLVLEDLHWCDAATVGLLSWLASQAAAAKLLVVVSLRPSESAASDTSIDAFRRVQSLGSPESHIALGPLQGSDIACYLAQTMRMRPEQSAIADWLHRRTGGNPLFLVNLVAYLQQQELWIDTLSPTAIQARLEALGDVVPDSLKCMIGAQIERLEPVEQELLLAASIAGDVFCAGVLGAALDEDTELLDERCQQLVASGQFIRHHDLCELPDGRYVDRYAFTHMLYRDGLSQGMSARRRSRLHQRIGSHKARVYAGSTHLIAAELVTHFEQAGNPRLAIRYLQESADNALMRYANPEAGCYLTSALELLDRLPENVRTDLEPTLLERRGRVHQAMADMRAAIDDFEHLRTLSRQSGCTDMEVSALLRLASAWSWIDRERCLDSIDEARRLSPHVVDETLRRYALGSSAYWNLLWRRWDSKDAEDCLDAATFERAKPQEQRCGAMLSRASYFLCLSGHYRQAADLADDGMSIASTRGDSSEYLLSLYFRCWALLHAGRWDLLIESLEERAFRIADSNDHHFWHLLFTLVQSWLEALCGNPEAARRSATQALAKAESRQLPFGRLLGLVRLGAACQELGRDREAHEAFTRCETWLAEERVLMDWIIRIPQRQGLARHWLNSGDIDRARSAAEASLQLASIPGEPTYMAAAFDMQASIAMRSKDWASADDALQHAFQTLHGFDAPLVSWRVHATAARLAEARGDAATAEKQWSSSARVLERLSSSLARYPEWRRSFDESAPVRAVLHRDDEALRRPKAGTREERSVVA